MGKNIKYVNLKAIDRFFSDLKNSNNLAPHIFFSEAGCGGEEKGREKRS